MNEASANPIDLARDKMASAEAKPIAQHVADWAAYLRTKGSTEPHVRRSERQCLQLLEAAGVQRIGQITASAIQRGMVDIAKTTRGEKAFTRSPVTVNHAARAVRSFSRWLMAEGLAPADGAAHVRPVRVLAARHPRRALGDDEVRLLIESAETGPGMYDLGGMDRAMLYRLALGTGLRASELRSLTPASLSLDTAPPTVTVEAGYSKRRRKDVMPLRKDLAEMLRKWLNGRNTGPLFPMSRHAKTSLMVYADLVSAGISPKINGKIADFHSLRYTFISRLARTGVGVKLLTDMARHSDPKLTLNIYAQSELREKSAALENLPGV